MEPACNMENPTTANTAAVMEEGRADLITQYHVLFVINSSSFLLPLHGVVPLNNLEMGISAFAAENAKI